MKLMDPAKLSAAVLAFAGALLAPVVAHAATYYVSPTGSDTAAGTEAAPFASMAKGQSVAAAGDTVYFKGGTYAYNKGTTTCSSGTATISGVVLSKSGTAGNLIKYWAAPGEKPVFDFDGILDSCRIKGILVSGSYIHLKGLEIKGVRQNNDLNHESWGVWIQGSNNIFELLNIHNIMGAGLFIQQGSNNLVLNCDSHHNLDEHTSNGAGESADGFGCHIRAGESGNVFRGCRAWWNADDGYDFINAFDACTVENSWAWYNGYRPDTMTAIGNGNGFKGGGYGADASAFPANPARHTVRNCLAFMNRAAGFYANHHPNSCYFYNNTGYGNHPNFNMLGMSTSGADTTVGVYRNNISFGGTLFSNRTNADEASNSWTVSGITVSDADFQSVSPTGMDGPRQADGSLPNLPNFRLAPGSDLIDKGTNVNLPYAGSAPDLGCFETGLATGGSTSNTGGATSSTGGTTTTGGGGGTAGRGGSGGTATTGGAGGRGGATGTTGGSTSTTGGNSGASGNAGNTGGATMGGSNTGTTGGTAVASGGTTTGTSGGSISTATGGNATGGTATAMTGGTGPGTGTGGAAPTGGSGTSGAGTAAGSAGTPEDSSGCACRTTAPQSRNGGAAAGSLLLLALAFTRRSRRALRRAI
ncbi:MAG TPA: right-handed parallel beta-helix repeat-containing protein [Polyangiaceae bacterium]|nr:right-handed parallel beta-helix repeat-containing protein [Polyangiaceae bacterium]